MSFDETKNIWIRKTEKHVGIQPQLTERKRPRDREKYFIAMKLHVFYQLVSHPVFPFAI